MTCRPRLEGYGHGDRLPSFAVALALAALPGFPERWAIVPGPNGRGLTLMEAGRCTPEDLARAARWARKQVPRIRHAARLPRPWGAQEGPADR